MKRLLFAWLPVLLLELVILLISSQSNVGVSTRLHMDKLAHIGEYAALSTLLYRALRMTGGRRGESFLFTVLLGGLLGGGDEWFQSTVPERVSSRADWLADCLGAFLGALGMNRLETRWPGWLGMPGPADTGRKSGREARTSI